MFIVHLDKKLIQMDSKSEYIQKYTKILQYLNFISI